MNYTILLLIITCLSVNMMFLVSKQLETSLMLALINCLISCLTMYNITYDSFSVSMLMLIMFSGLFIIFFYMISISPKSSTSKPKMIKSIMPYILWTPSMSMILFTLMINWNTTPKFKEFVIYYTSWEIMSSLMLFIILLFLIILFIKMTQYSKGSFRKKYK